MRKSRTEPVIILLAVLMAIPVMAQESPWPMFRHDLRHTGRSPFTGPASPELAWTFQANDAITASATIGHNGTIYVGAGGYYLGGFDSSLYAINPDGTLKWAFKTGKNAGVSEASGIFSSATIGDDGTIYVGSNDGHVYSIEDSVTYGKMKWKTNLGDWPVYGSPAIGHNGNIYAGSLNFHMYGMDPDGNLIWYYPTNWCVFSSPAIRSDGTIIVGSKDHNLYAFRDGTPYAQLIFKQPFGVFFDGHLVDCSPTIGDNGTIYVGTDPYGAFGQTPVPVDTVFFAVNPDGSRKWGFTMNDGAESSPAIGHDGTIYVGSYDSCVYAIEDLGTEGRLKWKFVTGGPVDASPTVDGDGTIYIGSGDSTLYALNPDGTVKWTFATGGRIESSVTINDNGYIYFGSFDGKLYCLGSGNPDVGTLSINVPDSVGVGGEYFPAATLRNYRGNTVTFNAIFTIEANSEVIMIDTVTVLDLAGGGQRLVSFGQWIVGPDEGVTYDISVRTVLADDDNSGNDAITSQAVTIGEVTFICGDINSDGSGPDISDEVYLIDYLFAGGAAPLITNAVDVNSSGTIDISDLTYMISYLFAGGPAPLCP